MVYFSHSGHTALLAEAIAAGALTVPATSVRLLTTGEATGADLMAADAFIIGCPTYFGDQASNFSAWVETTWMPYWQHGNFSGKKGAVCKCSGTVSPPAASPSRTVFPGRPPTGCLWFQSRPAAGLHRAWNSPWPG